jgi:aspartyl-tRNA synthetase
VWRERVEPGKKSGEEEASMTRPAKIRTHSCGELRAADAQKQVTLAGFVDRRVEAAEGGPPAIELRDASGKTRLVLAAAAPREAQEAFARLKPEDVVQASGLCVLRAKKDDAVATGEVELAARSIVLLSSAEPLPAAFSTVEPPLEERLRYRPLDLRRPIMQRRLAFRARLLHEVRGFLAGRGFLEIETPLLGKWTPEATRSFVVPAVPGKVFALPGTPQLHKQLLMAGGVERYFQIARCFRREERLTPERQLEFTVLDLEMAWADEADIWELVDALLAHVSKALLGVELKTPIQQLTYEEALSKYGTDRPDLRFGSPLSDLTALAGHAAAGPLSDAAGAGGGVKAFRLPPFARAKEEDLDRLQDEVGAAAPGTLTWLKVGAGQKLSGPAAALFPGPLEAEMLRALAAATGDVVVFALSREKAAAAILGGAARAHLGRLCKLGRDKHAFAWVTHYPFYRYVPRAGVYEPCRQPFTQPRPEDLAQIESDKYAVRTKGYDLVLDGAELGGGSIRNHDLGLQRRIFHMFEYRPEDVEARFGAVLDAFRFGVPPHGGIAIGVDRLVALLQGLEAIGEVIAFPKASDGTDPLLDAPSPMDPGLLRSFLEP